MTNHWCHGNHYGKNDLWDNLNHDHPWKNGVRRSDVLNGGRNDGRSDGENGDCGGGIHFYVVGGCDARVGLTSSF